jgi:hypothetical protein
MVFAPKFLKFSSPSSDKRTYGNLMTISDYQISSVIRTYVKNMKTRMDGTEKIRSDPSFADNVAISPEGMKRILFERIGEKMTEKLRRHEPEE